MTNKGLVEEICVSWLCKGTEGLAMVPKVGMEICGTCKEGGNI